LATKHIGKQNTGINRHPVSQSRILELQTGKPNMVKTRSENTFYHKPERLTSDFFTMYLSCTPEFIPEK